MEALETAVGALKEHVAELASDTFRGQEATAFLEERVRELEMRLELLTGTDADIASKPDERASEASSNHKKRASLGSAAAGHELECKVCESVWDACAVLGLEGVGWDASALLLTSSLLNVFVQVYLCYVLLTSDSFNPQGRFRQVAPYMWRWRLSTAHSHKELDTASNSLASRVCGNDGALSIASAQADILGEIDAYLEKDLAGFNVGATLCAACLILFAVLVLRELRRVVLSMLAFYALPRGGRTRMEGSTIVAISRPRLALTLLVGSLRAFVALALLTTGSVWLSSTSSITDLILNAAALGFIMDLDEMLFEAMLPMGVQKFVRNLAPLRVQRPPFNLEAIVPLFTSGAVVAICISGLVLPSIEDMDTLKQVLCGGKTDFVVASNSVGFVMSQETAKFEPFRHAETLEEMAVQELIQKGSDELPKFSQFHSSWSTFHDAIEDTLASYAETAPCGDWDAFNNGSLVTALPAYFLGIRHMTKVHAGLSLEEQPWACSDHEDFCDSLDAVRVTCPVTCGCVHPTSGLFYKGTMQGCPRSCQQLLQERLRGLPCTDGDVANTKSWERYWDAYAVHMNSFSDSSEENHSEFAERKKRGGCANEERNRLSDSLFCDEEDALLKSSGLASILGFCPETCCRGPQVPANCPQNCSADEVTGD